MKYIKDNNIFKPLLIVNKTFDKKLNKIIGSLVKTSTLWIDSLLWISIGLDTGTVLNSPIKKL